MDERDAELWWRWISGPSRFFNQVESLLFDGSSIVLSIPVGAWPDEFRSFLSDDLSRCGSILDAHDISETELDFGEYLITYYGNDDVAMQYRSTSGEHIAGFILRKEIIENRVVWITGLKDSQLANVLDFIRNYNSSSLSDGVFILEVTQEISSAPRGITVICAKDYFSDYQILSYAMLLASDSNRSDIWKKYTARLATNLFSANIMDIARFIKQPLFSDNPLLDTVLTNRVLGELNITLPNDYETIEISVWKVQVEVLFPLIEDRLSLFISEHSEEISIAAQVKQSDLKHNDDTAGAEAMDIGTVFFLLHAHDASNKKVIRCNNIEFLAIRAMRDVRNKLAHRKEADGKLLKTFTDSIQAYDEYHLNNGGEIRKRLQQFPLK